MKIIINNIEYVPALQSKIEKLPFNVLIFKARQYRDETLEEASNGMGIARSQLWSMEKGLTEPKLKMLQKVLEYYKLSFNQIQ